jgi:hypothetical protein
MSMRLQKCALLLIAHTTQVANASAGANRSSEDLYSPTADLSADRSADSSSTVGAEREERNVLKPSQEAGGSWNPFAFFFPPSKEV